MTLVRSGVLSTATFCDEANFVWYPSASPFWAAHSGFHGVERACADGAAYLASLDEGETRGWRVWITHPPAETRVTSRLEVRHRNKTCVTELVNDRINKWSSPLGTAPSLLGYLLVHCNVRKAAHLDVIDDTVCCSHTHALTLLTVVRYRCG